MKIDPVVIKETSRIAAGVLLGDVIMLVIFWLLKKLELSVFLGALLGTVTAIGNFFVMGIMIQKALRDPERTKAVVQRSYITRMLFIAAVLIVGFALPAYFHSIALVVPFLLPSITMQLLRLFGVYAEERGGEQSDET